MGSDSLPDQPLPGREELPECNRIKVIVADLLVSRHEHRNPLSVARSQDWGCVYVDHFETEALPCLTLPQRGYHIFAKVASLPAVYDQLRRVGPGKGRCELTCRHSLSW
jgi:hypothetical protein